MSSLPPISSPEAQKPDLTPVLSYRTPGSTSELVWEARPDGVFIQLPPPPRHRLLAEANFMVGVLSFFLLLLALPTLLIIFELAAPPGILLGLLVPNFLLIYLLRRTWLNRVAIREAAHRLTTIEISHGTLFISSPHPPDSRDLQIPLQEIRDLSACPRKNSIRLSIELENGQVHDMAIKCDLALDNKLEDDLRNALGLARLGELIEKST